MVVDPADSLDTALLPLWDARVPAFLPDACKMEGTLWVRGAFRLDCYKTMHLITIKQASIKLTFSNRRADLICISLVSRRADAS